MDAIFNKQFISILGVCACAFRIFVTAFGEEFVHQSCEFHKPAFLPLEIGGWRNWGGYWYGFTDEAQASGISLPSGWKLDDLDGLVSALAEEGFSLFPSRSWKAQEIVVTMAFSAAPPPQSSSQSN